MNAAVQWQGELRLMAIELDRVVFYTHPDDPVVNIQIGTRCACVLVQIGDDENPAVEERVATRSRPRTPSNMSAILCKEVGFQVWAAAEMVRNNWGKLPVNEDTAKRFVVMSCGIASRAELDSSPGAYLAYQTRVELPYYRHVHASQQ